jgi:dephospho-CoA kinase
MIMLKKIAITGGIGSGKSLVLQCAKELGYPTFSCDEIYKNIMATQEYVEIIRKSFPTCVKNNIINKNLLADIVFNDEKALGKLNSVAHPLIMQTLHEEMEKLKEGIVFAEVPLLFEGNYENDFHETIYVKRNFEDRIQ